MIRSFSLDDLIALNDEIRALARAGIPLDKGLVALSRDLPGRLRRNAAALGKSLEEGQSLVDALDQLGTVPPAYRAIVAAGVKTGKLAAALQGIATTSRRAAEVGSVTAVAMLYPLVVFAVATVVVIFTVGNTMPAVDRIYDEFELSRPVWYVVQTAVSGWMVPLLPWCWVGITLIATLAWLTSRRPKSLYGSGGGWLPGGSRLIREGQLATFTDTLALLIEQQLPLAESIRLAAESTGDRKLNAAADELSAQVQAGTPMSALPAGIPPLLGWLLVSGSSPRVLIKSLRNASAGHRRKAAEYGKWVAVYLPIMISAGFGGIVTFLYVLMVLGPFYHILRSLS